MDVRSTEINQLKLSSPGPESPMRAVILLHQTLPKKSSKLKSPDVHPFVSDLIHLHHRPALATPCASLPARKPSLFQLRMLLFLDAGIKGGNLHDMDVARRFRIECDTKLFKRLLLAEFFNVSPGPGARSIQGPAVLTRIVILIKFADHRL